MSRISRRAFLNAVGGSSALLALSSCAHFPVRKKRLPNIVFILMDDMGWKDPGFMGSDFYETPAVDRLAQEGITFTNAYAAAPNCAPTRASIMTGQYTPRHGIYTVGDPARGEASQRKLIPIENTVTLAPEQITLAEALKAAGYSTFHGGKWHLGEGPQTGPEGQGFDENIGGCHRGRPPGGYFGPWDAPGLEDAPEGSHICDVVTDHAIDFMERHTDGPFFMYVPFYDVHTPIEAKEALIEKYEKKSAENEEAGVKTQHQNAVYAAMVENADRNIGRLLARLDELGLTEDTIVFFFSDNGGYGGVTNMKPLRGCKGMLYEGGIREPLIVRWPGRTRPGGVCDVPVICTDFYPTCLEMAGAARPAGHLLDGESLVPLVSGRGAPMRDALFWHFPAYLQRLPEGFEEDSRDGVWRTTPCGVVRQGDWKLIEYFEDGAVELYNLREDVGERRNLAEKLPEKARELRNLLRAWREDVNAPVPTQSNPAYIPPAGAASKADRSGQA